MISVTQVDIPPWTISNSSSTFSRDRDLNGLEAELSRYSVGYEYAETMSQPLIAGRDFSRERSSDILPASGDLTSASGPFNVIIDDKAARSLASHLSHLIGLIYDDPSYYEIPSAGYVIRMQQGALNACYASKYELLIHPCQYRKKGIGKEIKTLIEQVRPDGIVLAAPLRAASCR